MPAAPDPYRERARAQFFEAGVNGSDADWFNGGESARAQLGGRTPTEAWRAGDHKAVEQLLDHWYADAEALAERHRANPTYMATIERLRAEIADQTTPSA